MARRLQADRPSHRPLAPAGDRLAGRLGRKQQQRGSQHRHPLDRGHPVGGRAASTSSQVDHPSSARNSTATTPTSRRIGCLAEDAQRRHGAATLKGVGHVGQHDGGEHHRRQGGQRRPPGRQGTPGRQPSNSAGPTGTMASETTASTGPGNPTARARTAPSSERADRVRGGRSITPGSGGSAPRASGGSRSVPMSRARICSTDRARGICPASTSLGTTPRGRRPTNLGRQPVADQDPSADGRRVGGEGLDVVGPLEGRRVRDRALACPAPELVDPLVAVAVHPVPQPHLDPAEMIRAVAQ